MLHSDRCTRTSLPVVGGSASSSAWLGMKPVSTLPALKSAVSRISWWYPIVVGTWAQAVRVSCSKRPRLQGMSAAQR